MQPIDLEERARGHHGDGQIVLNVSQRMERLTQEWKDQASAAGYPEEPL
jgi:hypothetical protein